MTFLVIQKCMLLTQNQKMSFIMAFIIAFIGLSVILFLLFFCLCVGGMLGILKFITPFLTRMASHDHDEVYATASVPINSQCFICLERVNNEVVATCNHSFCGECIVNYIQASEERQINCPACRQQILVLFRRFNPISDEEKKIKEKISQYNYKHTRQPSFIRAITQFGNTLRNLPILFTARGLAYLFQNNRFKYLLLLAVYTLFPFDFLPQAIMGPIGLIDDGVAVAGMIEQISSILYGFVREEHRRQNPLH